MPSNPTPPTIDAPERREAARLEKACAGRNRVTVRASDIRALLAASSGERGAWQDIATAPRDGRIIFLTSTHPTWKYPFPAKWDGTSKSWIFADEPLNDIWGISDLVTHWMQLGAPTPATVEEHKV